MRERDGFPPGVPCWIDTAQPDPEAAVGFYGELFGWTFSERMPADAGRHYFVAQLRGRDIAAVTSRPDATPVWNTYVCVDSADDATARVRDAGGSVLVEPFDLLDASRVAVFSDPSGAVFGVWQANVHKGAELVNEPGTWNWSDLNTRDPEGSASFYGAVFGWQVSTVDFGEFEGLMLRQPGYADFLGRSDPDLRRRHAEFEAPEGFSDAIGWIMPMTSDQYPDDVPPYWSVTFAVDDTDAIAERTAELGGRVVVPPFDADVVRSAVLRDPQGAAFSVNTFNPRRAAAFTTQKGISMHDTTVGRAGQVTHPASISVPQLRAAITGRVITPDDAEYDQARTVFSGGIDRRPVVIVRAADASDVSHVVSLARETGLELAVRSGGHTGHSVSDGGIVLDLSDMKGLDIDVAGRTAWAQTGLTAGEYTSAVGAHGLATGFGDFGSVGIGGITLGGGVGFFIRKYGLTIDDLLAAEVVTADGQLLHVDAHTHPDLFWAIRGGGGNFGVATRFQFRLHQVGTIVGGMLLLPATPDVITSCVAEAEAAPEELSAVVSIMIAPPMPFVPAEYHGQLVVMAFMVYAGETDAGERAVAPFRALATPLVDMIRPMPYPEIYPPTEDDYRPIAVGHTMFMAAVDRQTAETLIEHVRASTAPMAMAQIRVLGGALARVPADATAFAHRTARVLLNVAAVYEDPDETAVHEAWLTRPAAALPQGEPGVYVGFLDEDQSQVRDAYPGTTWDRLTAIKARYDPTNLFHLNVNIPPASEGDAN